MSTELLYDRKVRVVQNTEDDSEGVVFMQFNVLADGLCDLRKDKGGFILSPPESLPWTYRRSLIVAEIERFAPDVICLQELDHMDWMQTHLSDLGYAGHFVSKPHSPCLEYSNNADGCAIFLNRAKGLHMKHMCSPRYDLEDGSPSNQIALIGKIYQYDSPLFVVACTHLKATKTAEGEALRLSQVKQLHTHMLEHGDIPMIICGDFNAEPQDVDEVPALAIPEMLQCGWKSAYAVAGSEPAYTTWKIRPGVESRHVIDYIFYNDKLTLLSVVDAPTEIDDCRLPSLKYPSDHIALIAKFEIN
ncbi:unnamed protein product [Aphanomyces euteiches]|nr:hypothetical protein AeRB84_010383 [Aphanomyces euteiches]